MLSSDTLLIRHLPPDLSDEEKADLLQYFGAVKVKCLSSKLKKSSIAFAKFESEVAASDALRRLHQLDVLGYPLTVEFARKHNITDLPNDPKQSFLESGGKEVHKKNYEAFLHKLNTWNASLNFTQPPPPHLKYQYPPPSENVLKNILYALTSVPKFYTQVLHLMNKMNLPCPFDTVSYSRIEVPEILREWIIGKETSEKQQQTDEIEEESEYESEDDSRTGLQDIIPQKRTLPQKKKIKRPKFVKVTQQKTMASKPVVKPEQVFEKADVEPTSHKIELKLAPDFTISENKNEPETEVGHGFGLIFPVKDNSGQEEKPEDTEKEKTIEKTISDRELAENRIPERDQKHLPVFKNYQPGIPSCRLYIKNLAKQVEEEDLHYIFRRYIKTNYEEQQGTMYDIRLMKEGRMKGQAFVTLQNVKQAEKALRETNGFILKDKPMVVQFARSAKAN